ncbi:WhiB family transcriptional regulator [Nocardia sp. NPDC059180]|uniref:WhiB family transcriptional regulator n=1 Tax=Nocardia sp. NPDC059180 TaxID=3346761 RepID=UPI0036C9DBFB
MTGKGKWPAAPELLANLFDERLVGAACVGRANLFDDHRHGEDEQQTADRHAEAARICGRCPVRDQCDTAAAELDRAASGVWAGRVRNAGRPIGRPPRVAS